VSGLIIFPIFIFYVVVSFFVLWFITKKLLPKVKPLKLGGAVLAVVLIFPFWDLIVLKTIKEVYVLTHSNPIIYEQIKFDKNGKYKSLAKFDREYDSDKLKKTIPKNEFYRKMFNAVSSHIEFLVLDKDTNRTKILKVTQTSNGRYMFEFIDKLQAQYQIVSKPYKGLFGMYGVRTYKVIKVSSKKVIAKNYRIGLYPFFKDFRENKLLFITGTGGSMFRIKGAGAFSGNTILSQLHMLK